MFLVATEEKKREMEKAYLDNLKERTGHSPVRLEQPKQGAVTEMEVAALKAAEVGERVEQVVRREVKWDLIRMGIRTAAWLARKLR